MCLFSYRKRVKQAQKNDTKFQGYRMNSVGKTDKENYIMNLTVKPKKKTNF